jgi:hypothetical protein
MKHEIYRIFQCPRCKFFEYILRKLPNGEQAVICKASGLPIREIEKYGLENTAPECENWRLK